MDEKVRNRRADNYWNYVPLTGRLWRRWCQLELSWGPQCGSGSEPLLYSDPIEAPWKEFLDTTYMLLFFSRTEENAIKAYLVTAFLNELSSMTNVPYGGQVGGQLSWGPYCRNMIQLLALNFKYCGIQHRMETHIWLCSLCDLQNQEEDNHDAN
jgi:hypothetical protein